MTTPSPLALIGGRWAVSLRVWVIVALLMQIPAVVRASQGVGASAPAMLVPGVLGALALGSVLFAADRTILDLVHRLHREILSCRFGLCFASSRWRGILIGSGHCRMRIPPWLDVAAQCLLRH